VIAHSHFTRIADQHDVDAKTVERDYVLTHVLGAISQQPESHRMVCKGGTALRLCYFEDYRYSADLDFSLLDGVSLEKALAVVAGALERLARQAGFPYLALSADQKRIEYTGPLGRQRHLKLDIADDELVEEVTTRPLLPRYSDQPDVAVSVYSLNETAAEKLRCVIQRLLARDLFDLNELFVTHMLELHSIWPVFERKARHKQIDPARFAESFEKRMPHWKERWDTEMNEHLPGEPPEFDGLERAVRRALRTQLRKFR
jgi:predicted nucleotidyltransferase component of viral defense system